MTPIPDFDHLPLPAVAQRIRSLDLAGLDELIEHEQAHGDRLPVLEVLRTRRQELEDGATPSGGDQDDVHPETGGTAHGSPVDPSGAAESGPPDRHGLRQVTWGG
ncbi:hypothetical protein [Actinomycetospora sp. TBRC 11914]|uniref:hypothetical protein n=1 Tax=Actinomycetospora sp. TBRC 11914 TaxID=2729387 RepID=UPI00145F91BD|nr:hypothetical protein [Actinomycetospora sp. TBRC 11914]NMO93311.1 hypothetical protein [Actinomycetospora sp. TBRC 11914]